MNRLSDPALTFPWEEPPAPGELREVAEGILWLRLPLPMALDHVNIYLLDEGDGWTAVDTGLDWKKARAAWEAALAGPLAGKPVTRVLLTHHHPDHIGLLGWFAEHGAEVLATRTAWLMGRMLTLDRTEKYGPAHIDFRRKAGVVGAALEAYAAEKPFNFADCVAPVPLGFTGLHEGQEIRLGGRDWTVRLGSGHAPDHATLWSGETVLTGDQVIPGISPNIGVYPTEPDADPLAEWLESCERLMAFATPGQLALPGHKLPFRGLPFRLESQIENHLSALDRIRDALTRSEPTAVELMPAIFKREIGGSQHGLALVEAVAHMNHLWRTGEAMRRLDEHGSWRYSLAG